MWKQAMFSLAMIFSVSLMAQRAEEAMGGSGMMTDAVLQKRAYKASQVTEDRSDNWEVTALGQTTYTASNVMDGSTNSYQHTMRIVLGLVTPGFKNGSFQLVFYGASELIPQAAVTENGVVSIYYPISVYESLRSRLEQALLARKKVMVKATQKTNGFREGVLVF